MNSHISTYLVALSKALFWIICHIAKFEQNFFFFFFRNSRSFIYLFIYLFMTVLGLRFCARAFSSCGKWGPLFITVRRPLTIAASLVAEHRLQTRRLSNCGPRAQPSSRILVDFFFSQPARPPCDFSDCCWQHLGAFQGTVHITLPVMRHPLREDAS